MAQNRMKVLIDKFWMRIDENDGEGVKVCLLD
jgi:hypothetical protein